jgi:hypothetical protein
VQKAHVGVLDITDIRGANWCDTFPVVMVSYNCSNYCILRSALPSSWSVGDIVWLIMSGGSVSEVK